MVRHTLSGLGLSLLLALSGGTAVAEIAPEIISVKPLAPANPYRIYLSDVSIDHIVDGRLHVIDGQNRAYLGMIATGFAGQSVLSPDRKTIYVATTYYSRLNHGERTDVVDIHDAETLTKTGEIVIPPRHAQALNYKGTLRTSSDGRWLYVQNATPATSVTIVDLQARKPVAEVATPGCWIVLPAHTVPTRFSTVCGDGTMLTISLDGNGQPTTQKRSEKFFDPDRDPIFIHGEQDGDTYRFVSYLGDVYTAHLGGETASFDAAWPLVSAAERKAGWRPGGYQVIAQHNESGRLFVGMHAGGKDGSHKWPAKEIWAFDIAAKKRIAKAPGSDAIAIGVSRGAAPKLFAYDGVKGGIATYDADGKLKLAGRMDGVGETPTLMELQ